MARSNGSSMVAAVSSVITTWSSPETGNSSIVDATQARCMSSYANRLLLSNEQCSVLGAVIVILVPFTAVTNALLIAVTVLDRRKKKHLNAAILSVFALAIANMGIAMLLEPAVAVVYLGFGTRAACWLDVTVQAISVFLNHVTQCMICLMAADRFLRMSSSHGGRLSIDAAWKLLAVGCSYSLTVAILSCVSMELHPYVLTQMVIFSIDILLFAVTFALYIGLIIRVRVHVTRSAIYRSGKTSPPLYTKRLYKTVFAILMVMLVCYFPSYSLTIYTWNSMRGRAPKRGLVVATLSLRTLAYANSGLNALILLYRNSNTRAVLRSCWIKITCSKIRPDEEKGKKAAQQEVVCGGSFKATHPVENADQKPVPC